MKKKISLNQRTSKNPKKLWIYAGVTLVTLVIIFVIGTLWRIYHKDEPKFIPEETRKDVRGDLKENIAENLKKVWPSGGQALVDAAYGGNLSPDQAPKEETRTYNNPKFQFNITVPTVIKIDEHTEETGTYLGTITFSGGSGVVYDLDIFDNNELSIVDCLDTQSQVSAPITDITIVNLGERNYYRAIEAGDPDHLIFVTSTKAYFYKFKVLMDGENDLKNVLKGFSTN